MESFTIKQVEVMISNLPPQADGFRIAHLSDLHLRNWGNLQANLKNALLQMEYDLLVITGDFSDIPRSHRQTAHLLLKLLDELRPSLGIYGVLGNHDSPTLAEYDLPMTFLRNSVRLINLGNFEFYLAGIEQHVRQRSTINDLVGGLPEDAPTVVMAHYPSTAFELPEDSGCIMLSGHTHGGQIRLPGLGCVFSNDKIPNSMSRGLHKVNGNWLHVNPGFGVSSPLRFRVLCPPEISLLTFHGCGKLRSGQQQTRLPECVENCVAV